MLRLFQHPAVLLLLCFSLAGAPVTYRGGASDPHPHMFLEFLMDAGSGAFDHHHHGDVSDAEDEEHESHGHHHPNRRDSPSPLADPAGAPGVSISAFVVGDVGQLTFILPDATIPQSTQIETAFVQDVHVLNGMSHAPVAPPPR